MTRTRTPYKYQTNTLVCYVVAVGFICNGDTAGASLNQVSTEALMATAYVKPEWHNLLSILPGLHEAHF